MCRCNFCKREFETSQGAKAHLRTCQAYKAYKEKKGEAKVSSRSPTLTAVPNTIQSSTDVDNPFADLTEELIRQCARPDEARRLKEHRSAVLMTLCFNLVDRYRPEGGVLTPEMAVIAKVAILDELGPLATEALPQTELTLRATAIRNRVLAPYFRAQQHEQKQEKELRRQEADRIREEAAKIERRAKRKAVFVELGVSRALKAAAARNFTDQAVLLLECLVGARLEVLLVGDETETQAEKVIEAAIEGPLLECEERLEEARLARRDRMVDHCLTASLPVLKAALPWMQEVIVKKVCETFGQPPSPAKSDAGAAAEAAAESLSDEPATRPIRRRREPSESANMHHSETSAPDTVRPLAPSESRRAAR